ncbi:MAG TPA: phage portal protein [Phycisphaerae bacterium]|nr:phage portal protein [Phycisphaerae bacterium]
MRRGQPKNLSESFDVMRQDYDAAKQTRWRRKRAGVGAVGTTGDYHYRSEADWLRMIALSRDFMLNEPVVAQGVRRLVDNIVQTGFQFDPQTGDAGVDTELRNRFTAWAEDPEQCDLGGESTFHEFERNGLIQWVVDGDHFFLPIGDRLQSVEAHRCRTPSNAARKDSKVRRQGRACVHGVLIDETRRHLEYWFTRDELDPMSSFTRIKDVNSVLARNDAGHRQVYHVYRPDRMSQTRGVSLFAPVADVIGMQGDTQFAMMVKQQVASCFNIFRERDIGFQAPNEEPQRGPRQTDYMADGTARTLEGLGPALEIAGWPGEKLQGFSPNIPSPEFFPHMRMLLQFYAVNIGLPLELLLLDPTMTNFSGWRGAMDQARLGFRNVQRWFGLKFHSPVWRWRVRREIRKDASLRSFFEHNGEAIFRHRLNPPDWPYIEPMKDAAADLLMVRNALTSQRRRAANRGMDWEDLGTEIVEDNAGLIVKAHRKAQEIMADPQNKGLEVTWREVASLPTPDGLKVNIATAAGDQDETTATTGGDDDAQ